MRRLPDTVIEAVRIVDPTIPILFIRHDRDRTSCHGGVHVVGANLAPPDLATLVVELLRTQLDSREGHGR